MQTGLKLDYFDIMVAENLANADPTQPLKSISKDLAPNIERVLVDTSLHMPSMFEIHIADQLEKSGYRWIDGDVLRVGVAVIIKAVPVVPESEQPRAKLRTLICGEITSLECEFGADAQARLIVRGYDISHRLHLGQKSATFVNMTDADIAKKLAREAQITLTPLATEGRLEHVFQHNVTDMQFLRSRAAGLGFGLWVDEQGHMQYKPINHAPSKPVPLAWGHELSVFQPRVNARRQVGKVAAFSWNPRTKKVIQTSVMVPDDATAGVGELADQRSRARKRSGAMAREVLADHRYSHEQNKAAAIARAEEIAHELIEADGVCQGNPAVRAGCGVDIKGIGARFSGVYAVTSASHSYSHNDGYVTRFSISGCTPDTLTHMLADGAGPVSQRVAGVVVGLVTNVNDPEKLGRVKLKLPWLGDTPVIESHWCRVASLMGGPDCGSLFLPEVNDEVLVAFEHNDINAPLVIGALWNGVDKPPKPREGEPVSEGKVNQRILRSRSKHEIVFDDTAGKERVIIRDKDDNHIVIDASQKKLSIHVAGDCEINAKDSVSINSPSGDVSIKCASFSVEASRKCEINSDGTMTLKAGATVSLEAGAPMSIDGKPIQLNKQSLVVLP